MVTKRVSDEGMLKYGNITILSVHAGEFILVRKKKKALSLVQKACT